jgi:hypothetical protein
MKKNLYIFIENFFSKKHEINFEIKKLKKIYSIKIFSFVRILNNRYYKCEKKNINNFKYKIHYLKNIENFFDLEKENNKITIILDDISNEKFFNFKSKLSMQKKYLFVYSEIGLVPQPKSIFNLLNFFKTKYDLKYNLYIKSGLRGKFFINAKKIFYSWSANFQYYLNYKPIVKIKKPYSVFLDEILPNHPDYFFLKIKNPLSAKKYYNLINVKLLEIEKKIGHKIIILLHPKNRNNLYSKKFKFFKNKTCEIISNAKNVLLHSTTSAAYAVIFKKPLIYLNSKKFGRTFKSIVSFYDQTGGQYIDLDKNKINEFNFKNIKINKKKYQNYFDNYIKHPKASSYFTDYLLKKNLFVLIK